MTYDIDRYKEENAIKKKFSSIQELEQYWLDKNLQYISQYPEFGTPEEAKNVTDKTVKRISDVFQNVDEILHYDDYCYDGDGISVSRLSSEKLLIKRNGDIIKSVLIRMS